MINPVWRKSRRSNTQGGDCVEVASLTEGIGLRDSKDPDGGHLTLKAGRFAALIARIKRNDLDL